MSTPILTCGIVANLDYSQLLEKGDERVLLVKLLIPIDL